MILGCVLFFFQAEDGIRDLVRSRGLGDVYKRQGEYRELIPGERIVCTEVYEGWPDAEAGAVNTMTPVSYTHLTLPTSDLV